MLNNDLNPTTLSRLELLKLAQTLHVSDADVMTRAELRAAIERARRTESRPAPQPVTWLGVARRLIASIVEQGLHLPDAAAVIRGDAQARSFPGGPPPVATVTLARIYAAQGHLERGISTLDEVLKSDPDHDLARDLRAQLSSSLEEKRRQESEQNAAAASALRSESERGAAVDEESSPASDLLGAVPVTEEITLSGGAVAPGPNGTPEAEHEPEPRRGSSVPPAPLEFAPIEFAPIEASAATPPEDATPPVEAAPVEAAPVETAPVETALLDAALPAAATPAAAAFEAPPSSVSAVSEDRTLEAPLPAASAVIEPRSAGLVVIETNEPSTYLYWELASPAPASNGEPHWLCVVTHTAHSAGSARRELRWPVYRLSGALRLEGLPPHAVVRAKLSRGAAPEAPPLVVAGVVRARETQALERAELRFAPTAVPRTALPPAGLPPAALAARAADHLASAAPVYY